MSSHVPRTIDTLLEDLSNDRWSDRTHRNIHHFMHHLDTVPSVDHYHAIIVKRLVKIGRQLIRAGHELDHSQLNTLYTYATEGINMIADNHSGRYLGHILSNGDHFKDNANKLQTVSHLEADAGLIARVLGQQRSSRKLRWNWLIKSFNHYRRSFYLGTPKKRYAKPDHLRNQFSNLGHMYTTLHMMIDEPLNEHREEVIRELLDTAYEDNLLFRRYIDDDLLQSDAVWERFEEDYERVQQMQYLSLMRLGTLYQRFYHETDDRHKRLAERWSQLHYNAANIYLMQAGHYPEEVAAAMRGVGDAQQTIMQHEPRHLREPYAMRAAAAYQFYLTVRNGSEADKVNKAREFLIDTYLDPDAEYISRFSKTTIPDGKNAFIW